MNLREELVLLLPTRAARWSALLTSMLLLPAFLAPRFLQPLLAPKATEGEIVLAQILLPALIALVGTFVVLFQVIHAYAAKPIIDKPDITIPLEELREQILFFVSQQDTTIELVAKSMEISEQLAMFHLAELRHIKLVQRIQYPASGWLPKPPFQWVISQDGLAYLNAHGLLK